MSSDGFINAEGERQRRLAIPGTNATVTWLGDEDPTDEDIEAFQALVDAVMENEMRFREPRERKEEDDS